MTPVVAAVVCFLMALPGNKIFPSSCKPSASSVLCNHSRSARIRRKSAKSQVSLLFPPTSSATPQKVSCAAAGTLPIFRAREGPGTKLASAAAGPETDVTNSETCVIFDSDRPTQTNAILMPLPDDGVLSFVRTEEEQCHGEVGAEDHPRERRLHLGALRSNCGAALR